MLTTQQIYFLNGNPMARLLTYALSLEDGNKADTMFRFLREANNRQFPVTLSVEVDGVSCSMDVSFDHDTPGWHLFNYLAPWVASMALKDRVISDQMAEIWPDLPDLYREQFEKRAPQIAPQRP